MNHDDDVFNGMLNYLENLRDKYNIELKSCVSGQLIRTKRNGKLNYFQTENINGQYTRKGISRNEYLIRNLARKEYLKLSLEIIINNLEALNSVKKKYRSYRPDDIIEMMPKAYGSLPIEYFFSQTDTSGAPQQSNWADKPYRQSDVKPEAKVHTTSKGLRVRSKSELMISEKMYEHQIAFRYEQILPIGNKNLVPDFTIKKDNGEIIYWEHCGLTHNENYMLHHKRKLELYETIRIVPWRNLIVTYDDENGNINMAIIESEIINKLCN